jgi:hypothetical protein
MTEEQERCLDPYAVITVALDNDAAGMEKASLHLREAQGETPRIESKTG